ncbi:MAG: threonine synthase [Gemmatimonadetes bacterium]|nr:threonine synthase [Gemmatimonadota bacterium]
MSAFLHFECSVCGEPTTPSGPVGFAHCCGAPLLARYDLERANEALPTRDAAGALGVWRYRAVLPLADRVEIVSLGEGGTPLVSLDRLSAEHGVEILAKDESGNPTGSFKDRGMSVAVTLARAAGVPGLVLPTAGNAGAAAAAYGARAGLPVSIHAPDTTPPEILAEIRLRGARLTLHPGSIADAGRAASAEAAETGYFPVATFREPGRVEGKKTMAYEVFEQLGRVPDAIVYPCGGGTGVVAMARAFDELEAMGRIGPERPAFFAVQASGCAPIVRAFAAGDSTAEPWPDPVTFAAGLRVPVAFADRLILDALRRTGGGAVAVSDSEIADAGRELAGREGLLPCPEGAAAWAGARRLLRQDTWRPGASVVVFQTGSALKYLADWNRLLRT